MSLQTTTQNPFPSKRCEVFNRIAAGAVAGAASAIVAQPFDLVKTRTQLATPSKPILTIFKEIMHSRGVIGFYDGLPPSVMAATVHRTAKFSVHATSSKALEGTVTNPIVKDAISGGIAGIAQGSIAAPFELVKVQRMKSNTPYSSSNAAYESITQHIGVKGLTKGFAASVARDVIWNTVYFSLTPVIQKQINHLRQEEKPSVSTQLLSGALGGSLGSLANCPIDVAKSMIQSNLEVESPRLLDQLGQLAKSGGVRALYKGLSAKLLSIAPAGAVMWFVNDKVKSFLDESNPCDWFY